ncbi:MAG: preprotein translocase subunit SecG [Candidatus Edwardsbacteria bacterium]|nr:preprotein translocase subunit SecG [Candidatus Edwardsbacteria bacterium]
MFTFILIIHLIACLLLIAVVLMQTGKGGLGLAFGGGESFFGGRGAAPFMIRATTALAVVFMLTSLSLALVSGKQTRRAATAIEKALQQDQKQRRGPAPEAPAGGPGQPAVPAQPAAPTGK